MSAAMHKPLVGNPHGGALELHRGATFGEVSIPRPPIENGVKRALPRSGTRSAINYLTPSVAPNCAKGRGRGGPRNRADRESHALSLPQIANLKAAEAHSRAIGLPFTRMITIHWEGAGVPLAGMGKATGRFIDLISKAINRHGSATAYVWTLENGQGKGGHCHILAHVPADLVQRLTNLQKRWLRSISGRPYRKDVIESAPIGRRLRLERTSPAAHLVNVQAALAYIMKGACPEAAEHFGLERLEAGGRIIGKRCSTSQNIGATARKAKDR